MRRLYVSICIVILAFVSCGQMICFANKPSKGYNSFIEKFSKQSGLFEIRENWDLSIDKINAICSDRLSVGDKVFYCTKKTIRIKPGQIIIIPNGCAIISDTRDSIIGENLYEARSYLTGYLASCEKTTQTVVITKRIVLPPNCTLSFTDGIIENGVIDMAGGKIEGASNQILNNCIVTNLGNTKIKGRWFFSDNQVVSSIDFERFVNAEIDFGSLNLKATEDIRVSGAHWTNLNLQAPKIIIGNTKHLKADFPIWKSKNQSSIETDIDLSPYIDKLILLSFGEPAHYDWREKDGKPTVNRGITSVIKDAERGAFIVNDSVEGFDKEYLYRASDGTHSMLYSKGYIYDPCKVYLDSCTFYSTGRISPGFMYIFSGKDIQISNSSWIASPEGTKSLLGINNCVNGDVVNCIFKGAYYPGTQTSYGLQTINSTRINVKSCTLDGNRRGVDFSGNLCQSRYCIVEDCKVIGKVIEHEGSGLGGHSSSYGNIYRKNIIEGSSSRIGIETRGENEIIEGNVLNLPFSAAAITCAENTIIRNNVCENGKTPTFVWIESVSKEGNSITIENNKFKGNNLVRGQKKLTCNVTISGNTFRYASPVSSFAPIGNNVVVRSRGNYFIRDNEKAVLYYKYNNTTKTTFSEGLGIKDRVEVLFNNIGKLIE